MRSQHLRVTRSLGYTPEFFFGKFISVKITCNKLEEYHVGGNFGIPFDSKAKRSETICFSN